MSDYTYKESSIEWLVEIPEHWEAKKVKRLAYLQYGNNLPQDDRIEGEKQVYGSNGTVGSHKESNTDGNTIIIGRKGSAGALNFSQSSAFVIDTAFYIDERNSGCNLKWLYYLLQQLDLTNLEQESPVPGLNRGQVHYKKIPVPPPSEQKTIVDYLDTACQKIDRIIAKKKKQIEVLAEHKNSKLFEILTKGLNENADLIDPNILWMGKMPKHWRKVRLKDIVNLKSGMSITSLDIKESGPFPVFGGNGLRGYTAGYTHEGCFPIIGRQGALCGNINYARGRFWASEHAVVAKPIHNIDIFWLGELLRIMNLNQYSNAAAQPGLAVEKIRQLYIPFPEYKEQNEIAEYLKNYMEKVDAIIHLLKKQIFQIVKYQKSLIHECVTGKKKVFEESIDSPTENLIIANFA